MFAFIKGMLSDGSNPSSTRVIIFASMLILMPTLIGVWAYLSIIKSQMQPIDTSILGLITLLGGWHIGKSVVENKGI
jgi:hypothetical protein